MRSKAAEGVTIILSAGYDVPNGVLEQLVSYLLQPSSEIGIQRSYQVRTGKAAWWGGWVGG